MMKNFSPREIVSELDRHIIGQHEAKKSVALALRNRWRRQQLSAELQEEVVPKNILMIGPTGVGKTEIARRLAKLANAPFLKVEATKFTEVGYVGRDVESMIRDLVEISITMIRDEMREHVKIRAEANAESRVLDALVGSNASEETRAKFKQMLRDGSLSDREIEIEVQDNASSSMPTIDIPGMPGAQMGMLNLGDILGKGFGSPMRKRRMTVEQSYKILMAEESDKLLDEEKLIADAIFAVENNGIIFIDEIDKIARRTEGRGAGEVSREGVQRDLLPLIEGTQVTTKHGIVRTDFILFVASGAFHVSKPSDLLPELQGRLPTRVELSSLSHEDFKRILVEPEASLITQYKALLKTEKIDLVFSDEVIDMLADMAAHINETVENIGARRLHTVLEKLLEDISFEACDHPNTTYEITPELVEEKVGVLSKDTDLSRFIL